MHKTILIAALFALLSSHQAFAKTYEVKMVNRNDFGPMAYEPSFLLIQPGDTVKFLKTSPGHNAASIPSIWPQGAKTYRGNLNEEIEMTFDQPGFYGIECSPHMAMGMVMLIQVGDADINTFTFPDNLAQRALKRLEAIKASVINPK